MLRFLLVVGLVVTATYMLAPPRFAPVDNVNTARFEPSGGKPLLTSWGPTLQSLRDGPGATKPAPKVVAGKPAPAGVQTAADEAFHTYGKSTELWVIGQSNGWVEQPGEGAAGPDWTVDRYVEVDGTPRAPERVAVAPAPKKPALAVAPPAEVKKVAHTVKPPPAARPQLAAQKTALEARRIAKAREQARHAAIARTSPPRDRGLFRILKARKAERRAWTVAPPR